MKLIKSPQWLMFMILWIGIIILIYAYTDLLELLGPFPYLWVVVFIIAGLASMVSILLAKKMQK